MDRQDIILIQYKMNALGIRRDTLAKKIHCTAGKLNRVLDNKENNKVIEERLIRWLNRH